MFDDTNNIPIYVPDGSVETYKAAQYWHDYAKRIQAVPTPEIVDMGLSVNWASFNLGATKPEEFGDYYAWGETRPKMNYTWGTYEWSMGSEYTLTKYCRYYGRGYNGFTDDKTVLEPEDDAATANWGDPWRMPTIDEWKALLDTKEDRENYTWTWCDGSTVKYNDTDVKGWKIMRNSTSATIFLPAANSMNGTEITSGFEGRYWSSSVGDMYFDSAAWDLNFVSNTVVTWNSFSRYMGFSIRPVCTTVYPTNTIGNPFGDLPEVEEEW